MLPWHDRRLPVPARALIVFDLPFEFDPMRAVSLPFVEPAGVRVGRQRLQGDDRYSALSECCLGGVEEAGTEALVAPRRNHVEIADDATRPVLHQRATLDVESDEPDEVAALPGHVETAVDGVSSHRLPDRIAIRLRIDV